MAFRLDLKRGVVDPVALRQQAASLIQHWMGSKMTLAGAWLVAVTHLLNAIGP